MKKVKHIDTNPDLVGMINNNFWDLIYVRTPKKKEDLKKMHNNTKLKKDGYI